jgi:hypothetical protein
MSNDYLEQVRPSVVLDHWLKEFGYDKYRTTSENAHALCYVLTLKDSIVPKWRMLGANEAGDGALLEGFGEFMKLLKKDHEDRALDDTIRAQALLLVTHGTGRFSYRDPDTDREVTYDELDDEQKADLAEYDREGVREEFEGTVPCRIVNLITPSGLAADITMFSKTGRHKVERVEQWADDEKGTVPASGGAVDDSLMSAFLFMQLAREAVADGEDMNLMGLMNVAMKRIDTREGAQLMSFLLRMVAGGVESGIISFGEDDD